MLNLFKPLFETLKIWWAEFTLQTKLLAGATIVVSIVMSGLTFWAVNSIQENAQANDTRFGRDLGLLLAANVTQTIADNDREELARFTSQFYASTSSVRYIIYADHEGEIFFGIPYSEPTVKDSLSIQRRIQLPENLMQSGLPFVRQHESPGGQVTDVFVPLHDGVHNLGVMAIGINPNPTVVASSNLTRDVTNSRLCLHLGAGDPRCGLQCPHDHPTD
ncbi:MAG: hypothetical protein HC795_19230 [Coleofasciculaceae cyanobacterium RL_1_1]|nr:hypothetical protein [Coleofasciculaceae cyanobacterium RL_1_1]